MITSFPVARQSGAPSPAKTRCVFIGPGLRTAPPVYARALAGDFCGSLPVNTVARLAGASLICPDGDSAIESRWREALQALRQAGLLTLDADFKVSSGALAAALPRLKANGLEPGEALGAWLDAAVAAEAVQSSVPAQKRRKPEVSAAPKSDADELLKRCPEWLKTSLKPLGFLDNVAEGARARLKVLQLGEGDYSAGVVVAALKKLGVIPTAKNDRTMQDAVRAYFHDVKWRSRTKAIGCPEAVSELVECFREGQRIAQGLADETANLRRRNIRVAS